MKDVIFQGSRNRQPSGMAEVVLHLLRDETTEEEPDIEDIDSTLEKIDSHDEIFEAPELALASEPGVIATGQELVATSPATDTPAIATGAQDQVEAQEPLTTAPGTDTPAIATGAQDQVE